MQRIMRQRALSVDLNPDIEDACMVELGDMCSEDKEDVEKGAVSVWTVSYTHLRAHETA